MPTYFVLSQAGQLPAKQKQDIAEAITRTHSEATGAQGFFAQVIFQNIASGDHFMGGKPVKDRGVFVYGHIRAGRSPQQKKRLLLGITSAIADITGLHKRHLWTYVNDLPPHHMIEYGHMLPEPGEEASWFDSLPAADKSYLEEIGR
jgi:phenylpyruvate tautomerase PptA (4-oxalocrotonate tautomerase family)